MTRITKFVPGEYFHIYNRGVNKMPIFLDDFDYKRFQKLLYMINSVNITKPSDQNNKKSPYPVWTKNNDDSLVEIGAYCLMPNHFHLLVKSKNETNTALFLQRLQLSHSKYFNIKYDRSGSLFQGKVKATHITDDKQLKYLYSYIHLNPIKIIDPKWKENDTNNKDEKLNYLDGYKYSSYLDFLSQRQESLIINNLAFPKYFSTPEIFKSEIFDWLKIKPYE